MSENTPINKDSNILSVAIRIFSNHDVSRHQDRLMNTARKWYEISPSGAQETFDELWELNI